MKAKLTEEDIKKLNYQTRPGFIVSIAIFSICIIFTVLPIIENDYNFVLFELPLFLVLLSIVIYRMIWRYQTDIRNKEKILEIKTIQKKESIIDYEAGSGTLYPGQKMKAFDNYSIIIANTRFRVDKDFYETCNAGDEVTFHIAPKSKHRFKMELNKSGTENKVF